MAITSGVTVAPLSAEETRVSGGFTHKASVPYSVLVTQGAGNTTATIALLDVIAGDVVGPCAYVITSAWNDSDGSMNSLVVEVGDGNDPNRHMASTGSQLAEDGTEVDYFAGVALVTTPFAYTSADTIDAVFTCAGGANPTMAEWTSGGVDIFLTKYSLTALVDGTA